MGQLTQADLDQAVELFRRAGSEVGGARLGRMSRGTFVHRLRQAVAAGLIDDQEMRAIRAGIDPRQPAPKPVEVDELPDPTAPIEDILARRRQEFRRNSDAHEARRLIRVRVKITGPIGVALMGDPHVDDGGTDIDLLERHTDIINAHEALFGGNVGDYSNNWIGRLARLHAEQGTTAAEGWRLVEWLVRRCSWLFLVGGNHDLWSGAGDPIRWLKRSARVAYEAHGARLGLELPMPGGKSRTIRINARHKFPGRSIYNTAHGVARAAIFGWRDHVLAGGHIHTSGYNIVRDPASGLISHALQIGSYKTFDKYAEEQGFSNGTFTVCPVVIIRPQFADDDNRLISVEMDPETGAERLAFLRRRKSEPGV